MPIRMPLLDWQRSSVVEQGNHNPLVGGSNPSAATTITVLGCDGGVLFANARTPGIEPCSSISLPPVYIRREEDLLFFTHQEMPRVQGIFKRLGIQNSRDIVLIDARNDNKLSGSKA